MYLIGKVIYGVVMNKKLDALMTKLGTNDFFEDDPDAPTEEEAEKNIAEWESDTPFGFERIYSGDGYIPGFCGVELYEFDECNYGVPLSRLRRKGKPTDEQKKAAEAKIAALRPEFRALLKKPRVWVVWDHS